MCFGKVMNKLVTTENFKRSAVLSFLAGGAIAVHGIRLTLAASNTASVMSGIFFTIVGAKCMHYGVKVILNVRASQNLPDDNMRLVQLLTAFGIVSNNDSWVMASALDQINQTLLAMNGDPGLQSFAEGHGHGPEEASGCEMEEDQEHVCDHPHACDHAPAEGAEENGEEDA